VRQSESSPQVDVEEWRSAERERLLAWATRAMHPCGFAWLDDRGEPLAEQGVQTWITARGTFVGSLGMLHGLSGAREVAEHGVGSLLERLRDEEHDGWPAGVDLSGAPREEGKAGYAHAFVLLAGATASSAGVTRAGELLDAASRVVLERFWDADAGLCLEGWDRAWHKPEDYGGANSNMHMVEAFLAAAAATGEDAYVQRAARIADFFIAGRAAERDHRLPEHYTADWRVLPEYNQEHRQDPFRPYGWTPGHSLEWARLLLHLEATRGEPSPALLNHAESLFDTAVQRAWACDGADGFVYTLDWQDRPVVPLRMHWVAAEAVSAAEALYRRPGRRRYADFAAQWWRHIRTRFVDGSGNWIHELGADLRPSTVTWQGRPDVYHAYTAVSIASEAPVPGFALRFADGGPPKSGTSDAAT
jgi:sulfoquinovose isomerase